MTEKSKRVDYEMKYIGWNIGATRIERHETKGGIEILELKIDGVDVLKQLEKAEKLEAIKKWYDEHHTYREVYDVNWNHLKKILEAEG